METTEKPVLQVTLKELIEFLNSARDYQDKYSKERSRQTYLLIKQTERYNKKRADLAGEMKLKIDAINYRHASVDDKDNIIETKVDVKAGKGEDSTVLRFAFKKEAKAKCDEEIDKLNKEYEAKIIDIEPPYPSAPYYLPVPENFDFNFLTPFKKFIFNPEISEEEELRLYMSQKPEQKPTVASVLNGQ